MDEFVGVRLGADRDGDPGSGQSVALGEGLLSTDPLRRSRIQLGEASAGHWCSKSEKTEIGCDRYSRKNGLGAELLSAIMFGFGERAVGW